MTELLSSSDREARWIGIRRVQAVTVGLALVAGGDALVRRSSSPWELFVALASALLAVPLPSGELVSDVAVKAVHYAAKPRLKWPAEQVTTPHVFELVHVGRLRLTDSDVMQAAELTNYLDQLALVGRDVSVTWFVDAVGAERRTYLATSEPVAPPSAWRPLAIRQRRDPRDPVGTPALERWRYLRTPGGVSCVMRIREFAGRTSTQAVLDTVQHATVPFRLIVQCDVVPRTRALRVTRRAAHGIESDRATTRAGGFRHSATASRRLQRVRQREGDVAAGRALVRLAVSVVVLAATRRELRARAAVVCELARAGGLRVDRGAGHQAEWFAELPAVVSGA
jgi:hypothetical protein